MLDILIKFIISFNRTFIVGTLSSYWLNFFPLDSSLLYSTYIPHIQHSRFQYMILYQKYMWSNIIEFEIYLILKFWCLWILPPILISHLLYQYLQILSYPWKEAIFFELIWNIPNISPIEEETKNQNKTNTLVIFQ